jgi:hypothetical protein
MIINRKCLITISINNENKITPLNYTTPNPLTPLLTVNDPHFYSQTQNLQKPQPL